MSATAFRVLVNDDEACSICLDNFTDNEELLIHYTNEQVVHKFHKKCVEPWLKINLTCPLCKSQLRYSKFGDDPAIIPLDTTDLPSRPLIEESNVSLIRKIACCTLGITMCAPATVLSTVAGTFIGVVMMGPVSLWGLCLTSIIIPKLNGETFVEVGAGVGALAGGGLGLLGASYISTAILLDCWKGKNPYKTFFGSSH